MKTQRQGIYLKDGETDYFEILAGGLQGDTLAPYLFAIVIDYITRKAVESKATELGFALRPRRSKRVDPVNATDFCFADDIVLLANEIKQKNYCTMLKMKQQKLAYTSMPRKRKQWSTTRISMKSLHPSTIISSNLLRTTNILAVGWRAQRKTSRLE